MAVEPTVNPPSDPEKDKAAVPTAEASEGTGEKRTWRDRFGKFIENNLTPEVVEAMRNKGRWG